MMRNKWVAILISCVMVGRNSLKAAPPQFSGSLYLKGSGNQLSLTRKAEEELILIFTKNSLQGGIRLDNYHPFPNRTRVMKWREGYLGYLKGNWEIRAGDFTETFGHGILLSSYRFKELDVDTLLRGVRGKFTQGRGVFTAFSAEGREKRKNHCLTGAHLSYEFSPKLRGGMSAISAKIPTPVEEGKQSLWGADAQYSSPSWDASLEYTSLVKKGLTPKKGHSLYADFNWYALRPFTVSFAWKNYRNINYPYALGPTLKSNFETANYDDEMGFQATVLYAPSPSLEVKMSHNESNNSTDTFPFRENEFTVRIFPEGKTREVYGWFRDKYDPGDTEVDFELDVTHDLTASTSLVFQWYSEDHTPSFQRYKVRAGAVGFFLDNNRYYVGYTAQKTTRASEPQRDWGFLECHYNPTNAMKIQLFWGSDRGGRQCTSGICVIRPPMEGSRLEITSFF